MEIFVWVLEEWRNALCVLFIYDLIRWLLLQFWNYASEFSFFWTFTVLRIIKIKIYNVPFTKKSCVRINPLPRCMSDYWMSYNESKHYAKLLTEVVMSLPKLFLFFILIIIILNNYCLKICGIMNYCASTFNLHNNS